MEPFTSNTGKIQTYLCLSVKIENGRNGLRFGLPSHCMALYYLAGRMHKGKLRVDLGGMCISPDALSMHFSIIDAITRATSSSVDLLRDQSTRYC